MTDDELFKCFGKKKHCLIDCRFKKDCRSRAVERDEEWRRQTFEQEEYSEEMDEEGTHTLADFQKKNGVNDERLEKFIRMVEDSDLSYEDRTAFMEICNKRTWDKNNEEAILQLLRRMGELYIHDQIGFEVVFFQMLAKGNQAKYARLRGCTKQNINKRIASGQRRLKSYLDTAQIRPGARLSPLELAVFRAVEIEKMTYRQAAEVCGVTKWKIQNTVQNLRLKGIKTVQKRPGRRKNNGKSNNFFRGKEKEQRGKGSEQG